MVNKTLLYKHEFINIDKNSLPKFSPEEIGHILLNIEKGIIKTPTEFDPIDVILFEGKKYGKSDRMSSFEVIDGNIYLNSFFYPEPVL